MKDKLYEITIILHDELADNFVEITEGLGEFLDNTYGKDWIMFGKRKEVENG